MESHDTNDSGTMREGEPREAAGSRAAATQPNKIGANSSDRIGEWSLACACLVWLGTCLTLMADLGSFPKGLTHNLASFLFLLGCLLMALIGGAYSALNCRSTAGFFALSLGALHLIATVSCISLLSNGWFGPVWLD
jgi:hypothetical protein